MTKVTFLLGKALAFDTYIALRYNAVETDKEQNKWDSKNNSPKI